MVALPYDEAPTSYTVREVVARFMDADAFEEAVEALEFSGVNRTNISILASYDAVSEKLGHKLYVSG